MELTHIFEITLSFKLWFHEKKFAVDLVIPRGVYLSGRWIYLGREDNFYLASFV